MAICVFLQNGVQGRGPLCDPPPPKKKKVISFIERNFQILESSLSFFTETIPTWRWSSRIPCTWGDPAMTTPGKRDMSLLITNVQSWNRPCLKEYHFSQNQVSNVTMVLPPQG